jgi:hypothetical protein
VKVERAQPENAFCRIENLRAETHKPNSRSLFIVCAFPRTVSPFTCSCPASVGLRASFWLAPWLSTNSCELPEDKARDASDRLLPPERSACTRTSCVPGSLRGFHRVCTPRSLGLRAA